MKLGITVWGNRISPVFDVAQTLLVAEIRQDEVVGRQIEMFQAVLFFIIGDGGNGKSVFIDVISSICGKENVCNISLNRLNDEKYLPELFGKMINVSGETPSAKQMNTDLIKSVVAGDWVPGRRDID